jgi:pimeloyl-ACP methyl ester carboxylesterase
VSRYQPIDVPLPEGGILGGAEWAGTGVPVLAVQGLGSNHRVFDLLAKVMPDRRIISVDARGRASGAKIPSPNGITTQADDLAAVLDHLGIDKAVVVGHSMGGFVSLRFAQRHPERVAGLVLVDGGPPVALPGPLKFGWAIRFAFNKKLPKKQTYASFDEFWKQMLNRAGAYDNLDPEFIKWGFEIDVEDVPGGVAPVANRDMMLTDAIECFTAPWRDQALKEVSVPTRLLLAEFGEDKTKKPLYRKEPAASALSPTVTVTRIKGTDHLDMLWHPDTVAAIESLSAPAT